MIIASDLFVQKLSEPSREFRAQLLDSNGAVVPGIIRSITVNKGACGEDAFSVGSIYSSFIEVVMDECTERLENKELLMQMGVVVAEDEEDVDYIDLGYYTVTKPKSTVYQTSFTAVGRISSKLNCLPNELPAEQTLSNLAAAITATTGVTISCKGVTLEGTIEMDITGQTCLNILKIITDVLGGFATEDNTGGIVISKFATDNIVEYNGDSTTVLPEFNDYDYELSGVAVIVTEDTTEEDGSIQKGITYTEGTPRQTLIMPYMTESLFSAFVENVIGYTYRPGTVPLALGDPRLEPWDCLSFTDVKGNTYIVPCLNIVHTFDGGLSTTITAPGSSVAEEDFQIKGPVTIQIENLKKDVDEAISNIQIGGTNLLRNSQDLIFDDYYFYPIAGVMLLTSDGYALKDSNSLYITAKESE